MLSFPTRILDDLAGILLRDVFSITIFPFDFQFNNHPPIPDISEAPCLGCVFLNLLTEYESKVP